MITTTMPEIEGRKITAYHGIVTGVTTIGANIIRDIVASIIDVVGGRSGTYEANLQEGREIALQEMQQRATALGENAVVGVNLDYEILGKAGSMLMVSATGTAVTVE